MTRNATHARMANMCRRWLRQSLVRLAVILLCTIGSPLLAADNDDVATPSSDRLVLTGQQDYYLVGQHLRLLEDKTGSLTPAEAWSAVLDPQFENAGVDIPNRGITASTFWAKLTLENRTMDQDIWFLGLADAMVQYVELHQRNRDGSIQTTRSGSLVHGSEKQRHDRSPSFKLLLPPGETLEILIRIRTDYASVMPLSIATPVAYARTQQDESILHGLFLGTTFALMVYNLFVFWATRDKTNLIYVVFLFSNTLNAMALNGSLGQKLPEAPLLVNLIFMLSYNITMTISATYARAFLNPDAPTLKWLERTLIAASVCAIAAFALGIGNLWAIITTSTAFIASIFVLTFAFQRALQGEIAAIFYSLGFGSFLLGGIVFMLAIYNFLPFITATHFAMEIGSIIEAIMLSLAMAARHRDLKIQQEKAQQEVIEKRQLAIDMINEYREHLQQDVAAHTRDLVATQQELVSRQKMAALGVMTAGVAHEVNNPNNFIIAGNQNALAATQEFREFIGSIIDETETQVLARINGFLDRLDNESRRVDDAAHKISAVVAGLGKVSRLHEAPEGVHSVQEGLRETLRLIQARARQRIHFDIQLCDTAPIHCRPAELNEAFMNILMNALHAVESKCVNDSDATATIRVSSHADRLTGRLLILISDNGNGMSAETLARVQAEASLSSTGLSGTMGIAIAAKAIAHHGGALTIDSVAGRGTTVTIGIPHDA